VQNLIIAVIVLLLAACSKEPATTEATPETPAETAAPAEEQALDVSVARFADVEVLRYEVPGFSELSLKEKRLAYYLSQAALAGRDIIYDQNYEHNLRIRKLLAAIIGTYSGDREEENFLKLVEYAKRVWFAHGIHHHYSSDKMLPEFTPESLIRMVANSDRSKLPLDDGQSAPELLDMLRPIMFDPDVAAKKITLDPEVDVIVNSATNYYSGVTAQEVADFYAARVDEDPERPVSWGLNSQLAKVDAEIVERTWKIGGMYGPAIAEVARWLEKASEVAENETQKAWIDRLIHYYRTGDLADFDAFNIAWVADTDSRIDAVNGFIEVYGDPLGYRGAWESVVSLRDLEATDRIATIGANAQWFEDNSPILGEHKKEDVVGISAKVITVIMQGGDLTHASTIGINLPNPNWIRKEHGSKSVTLGNLMEAYEIAAAAGGLSDEFSYGDEEKARNKEHGALAQLLRVDMHEVIGHASGQINPGVGTPNETLKSYASALEEARADLVAMYYVLDPKLVELGLMPSLEVGKAAYDSQIKNGLQLQLRRVELGNDIEQAHMRNRQLIASWAYEMGLEDNVIERIERDGKNYFVINDYAALRGIFAEQLREIQRIKSEGDFEAGQALIETYGVKIDRDMHEEVLARVEPLNIAPYKGFIQPQLVAVEENGEIVDVRIEHTEDFVEWMLESEEKYSFLPISN
jgi:dipeptidyl-peptidase-3